MSRSVCIESELDSLDEKYSEELRMHLLILHGGSSAFVATRPSSVSEC